MMKLNTVLLAVAVCTLPAFGAGYSFELKPENTRVQWTLGDVLHTVNGTFKLKSGQIDFEPATNKASGRVIVDATSGESGSGGRDKNMHNNVLESKKYPDAVFVPTGFDGTLAVPGTASIKIHGMLTLHGAPHEVTMDAQVTTTADKIQTKLTFEIPYVAWAMKDPSNFLLKVSKTVQMTIETSGVLQKR
jgi:polyisoprenoid-binding protein YceI